MPLTKWLEMNIHLYDIWRGEGGSTHLDDLLLSVWDIVYNNRRLHAT